MSTSGAPSSCRAQLLADVEHRRLVALALADHDAARDLHLVEDAPHRLDRDAVGVLAVAAAHGVGRRDRRLLGDGDEVLLEQPLEAVGPARGLRARASGVALSAHRAAVFIEASRAIAVVIGGWNAGMPVMAAPITRPWMSWVPS